MATTKQVEVIDVIDVRRHKDQQLLVPEDMPLDRAIDVLTRRMAAEEEPVDINDTIPTFPWDGALALARAIEEQFGFVMQQGSWSFFGKQPPRKMSVEVSSTEKVSVPWGAFTLPGIDGLVSTGTTQDEEKRLQFVLSASVKGKHETIVRKLFARTRELALTNSIYRGKAFTIRFCDSDGEFYGIPVIKFIDTLSSMKPVFRREIEADIERNVLVPIRHAAEVRAAGENLKRGVVLAGPYGTGKTLLSSQIAEEAVEAGWTFIYVTEVRELPYALRFAQRYQPCVVLGEDIDRAAGLERTDEVNELLNTLDGIDSKTGEIILVLTTNHVDRINPAMLRPGRVDIRIYVDAPDAEAAERIIRLYGGALIAPDDDLRAASEELAGEIAATIGEVVKRAKLEAIRRAGSASHLTGADLHAAAESFKRERERFAPAPHTNEAKALAQAGALISGVGETVKRLGNGAAATL